MAVAPYEVVITPLKLDAETMAAADTIYAELRGRNIDVLFDDRDARAGVKFADAELIGAPYRITLGPKGLANGEVELTPRASGDTDMVPLGAVAEQVVDLVVAAR